MANYGKIYYHEYYDIGNALHRIEILEKDYTGDSELITTSSGDPVTHRHIGSKDEIKIIQGSELVFNFLCFKNDFDKYDSFFEADYKDYKIKYYVSAELVFEGYPKPENLTKEYKREQYFISLSATDALADLKNIDFGDGSIINDKLTILKILQHALTPIGIELDFQVQLGAYEKDYMASTECALKEISVDTRRFFEWKTGKREVMSCHEVIEAILKDFNVTLKQHKGKYQITNFHELDSYQFLYDWSTLTQQSRTATDNIIDLANRRFEPTAELQKINPLKTAGIIFKNKDLGGNVTGMDLDDLGNDPPWEIDFSNGYSITDNVVTLNSDDNTYDDFIETAAFNVAVPGSGEKFLKITFDHILFAHTSPNPLKAPLIKITITRPDSSTEDTYFNCREYWESYESPIYKTLKVIATGNYSVRLSFKQVAGPSQWTTASFKLKMFRISTVINSSEGELLGDVVFDEYYKQTSNKGIEVFETETILADGGQITEVGALLYDNSGTWVNTGLWNSYGYTENIKLLDIYARNILNNRYDYKDYIRINLHDSNNEIDFNNILTRDDKYYIFISFSRNCKKGIIGAEIVELLTTRQSYNNISRSALNSIDGERTSSSVNVSWVAASELPSHGELEGLSDDDHSIYHTDARGDARYYTETEVNTWRSNVTQQEMDWLHGITSDVQTQISANTTHRNDNTQAHSDYMLNTGDTASGTYNFSGIVYADAIGTGLDVMYSATIGNHLDVGDDLTVDTDTLIVDSTTHRVGIGTATPGHQLTLNVGTQAQNAVGAALALTRANNALYGGAIWGGLNTDGHDVMIFGAGANADPFAIAQARMVIVGNTGNVGIGTATPGAKLHIKQSVDTTAGGIYLESSDSNTAAIWREASTGALVLRNNTINVLAIKGGQVGINDLTPSYVLDVNGTGRFTGNLYGDANVEHLSFVGGWFGNNWQIAENGDVEFMNMVIRGSARFRELIIDQLAILSGSQLLSVARGKVLSVDIGNSKVTLDDPNNKGACAFLAGDFFWSKTVDIDRALFSDNRGQITNVTDVTLTLDFGVAGANGSINDFYEGDVIVQRGHPSTASRQNLMYATVSDADAPFQRTITGVDSLAAFNDLDNVVLQSGNLESLASHDIVPATPGYGLYSDNVYLSGKIIATSGEMSEIGSVLFQQDAGTFEAIKIEGKNLWENELNSDSGGGIYINVKGYNGAHTKFRTTIIGDGKNTAMAEFSGENQLVTFPKNVNFTSNVGIGTTDPGVALEVIGEVNIGNFANNAVGNLQIKGDGANGGLTVWNEATGSAFRFWVNDAANTGHLTKGSGATNGISIGSTGYVGIGDATPDYKLDVTGRMRSTLGRVPAGKLHGANITLNTVFDALAPSLPATNDEIIVSGAYEHGGTTSIFSYAKKTSATVIDIYLATTTGVASTLTATDGSGTTIETISIAW